LAYDKEVINMNDIKFLIVEDDKANWTIIDGVFAFAETASDEKLVHEILHNSEHSKDEIVDYFFRNEFDVIIADYRLYGCKYDGWDIVASIHKTNKEIPAIIFTAYADGDDGAYRDVDDILLVRDKNEKLENIIPLCVMMVNKFRAKIDHASETLLKLSQVEIFTDDQEIEYIEASSFLESINCLPKDVITAYQNNKTLFIVVKDISDSFKKIEKFIDKSD